MSKITIQELDKILSAHRKILKPGKVITRARFITMVQLTGVAKKPNLKSDYVTLHRQNMRLVAEQQRVNELMRANGLYLKARKYYSEFEVCSKDDTKNVIVRYAGQVERSEACEEVLDTAMASRVATDTWSYYNRVYTNKGQIKRPTAIAANNHSRQIAAAQRVKNY